MSVKTSDFDYDLPRRFIAQKPAEPRDSARLMVLRRDTGAIEHRIFRELPELLSPGDVLILNDTRVIPARLFARRKSGGAVEILLIGEAPQQAKHEVGRYEALIKGHGRVKEGEELRLVQCDSPAMQKPGDGALVSSREQAPSIRLLRRAEEGRWIIEPRGAAMNEILTRFGAAPLPPYIKRDFGGGAERDYDLERYQTTFARHDGSIAAPTAGMHFTRELLARMEAVGVKVFYITLHVGPGTFKSVTATTPEGHTMDSEWYMIPEKTAEAVNAVLSEHRQKIAEAEQAFSLRPEPTPAEVRLSPAGGGDSSRQRMRRIVAVGTTVCRTLEHAARAAEFSSTGILKAGAGMADIFIYPPFSFRVVSGLVTNFHLPRGTPLMLVCAFAGRERILNAYEVAKKEGYRFFSYGDAMLVI